MTPAEYQYFVAAYRHILLNPSEFHEGFDDWLYDNIDIQRRFDAEALGIVKTGRVHYSAYIIVQYLRHYTNLRTKGGDFKISNNWTPSMARLFGFMHPQHKNLFSYHELFRRSR